MKKFKIAIIGGGVIGSAIARELSKYDISVVVFEKGSDVANGASKANSGVIHSGINSIPFSKKSYFCINGNKMIRSLAKEFNLPIKWIGKFVIAKNNHEIQELKQLHKIGRDNGILGLEIKDLDGIREMEPNISCISALWVPNAGIISPYQLTIALAENAAINDVKFLLETKVTTINKINEDFLIETNKGQFISEIIINAAGLHCRDIVSMLEEPDFQVYPCRGEYLVLDKNISNIINSMIYPVPNKKLGVLGVHFTPTIEGNIILGPTAEYIDENNDTRTTKEMMEIIFKESKQIISIIDKKDIINTYSGIRCRLTSEKSGELKDFRIEMSEKTPGLINLIGIESPGLTAAPAIAKEIKFMVSQLIELKRKKIFKVIKREGKHFSELSLNEKSKKIRQKKTWGKVICRCENVTEEEVIQALSNPLGAHTLTSIKYRCRAGMGRCQGGFCMQHIIRIMEEQFGMGIKEMKLKSPNSYLFNGRTRGNEK